ncbi:unnamed protein product [Meganyctiphanes norvegica]|uniref:Uncharacterized protein n=1 Tax=Meganyctiphanes norvegica TaxID=48144 RepID=A0AAV2SNB3_MEGNR
MAPSQFSLCSWPVQLRILFSGSLGVYCVSRWGVWVGTWSTLFMCGFLSAPATSPDRCCFVFLQCLSYGVYGRLPGSSVWTGRARPCWPHPGACVRPLGYVFPLVVAPSCHDPCCFSYFICGSAFDLLCPGDILVCSCLWSLIALSRWPPPGA